MADDALAAALAELGTATVYEASGRDIATEPVFAPMWPGARAHGRALPVRCGHRDNLPLHRAVAAARPGEVLLVDAGRDRAGYWGEVLTVAAQVRQVAGLVIDGGVRDIDALQRLAFPVFAAGTGLAGTRKDDPGSVGEPIRFAGVPVARGDIVIADPDGVVVVPAATAEDVLQAASARARKEEEMMARLRAGKTILELLGLTP